MLKKIIKTKKQKMLEFIQRQHFAQSLLLISRTDNRKSRKILLVMFITGLMKKYNSLSYKPKQQSKTVLDIYLTYLWVALNWFFDYDFPYYNYLDPAKNMKVVLYWYEWPEKYRCGKNTTILWKNKRWKEYDAELLKTNGSDFRDAAKLVAHNYIGHNL